MSCLTCSVCFFLFFYYIWSVFQLCNVGKRRGSKWVKHSTLSLFIAGSVAVVTLAFLCVTFPLCVVCRMQCGNLAELTQVYFEHWGRNSMQLTGYLKKHAVIVYKERRF